MDWSLVGSPGRLVGALAVLSWIIDLLAQRRTNLQASIIGPVFLFLVATLFTSVLKGQASLRGLYNLLVLCLLFLITIDLTNSIARVRYLLAFWLLPSGLIATLSLLALLRVPIPDAIGQVRLVQLGSYRVMGLANDPNYFAMTMVAPVALGLAYWWYCPVVKGSIAGLFLFSVSALALVASGSRGSMVSVLAGVATLLLAARWAGGGYSRRVPQAYWKLGALVLILVIVAILANQPQLEAVRWTTPWSRGLADNRTRLWLAALEQWATSPLFGTSTLVRAYGFTEGAVPHSVYLGILLGSGIIGLVAFVIMASNSLRAAWRLMQLLALHPAAKIGEDVTLSIRFAWLGLVSYLVNIAVLSHLGSRDLWLALALPLILERLVAQKLSR